MWLDHQHLSVKPLIDSVQNVETLTHKESPLFLHDYNEKITKVQNIIGKFIERLVWRRFYA